MVVDHETAAVCCIVVGLRNSGPIVGRDESDRDTRWWRRTGSFRGLVEPGSNRIVRVGSSELVKRTWCGDTR